MAGEDFRNVFVVADDDQIIYHWNGADYARIVQFQEDFHAALLQIPTNYRCPAEVVECANKLIACNRLRSADKRPLVPDRDPFPVHPAVMEDSPISNRQGRGVTASRTTLLNIERVRWEQTAVLARVRNLLDPIATALTALGISSQSHRPSRRVPERSVSLAAQRLTPSR